MTMTFDTAITANNAMRPWLRGVPAHYEYAPFGEVTVSATNTAFTAFNVATTNPYRFSSEYADDELGLVYYNYRHYEPVVGRWAIRDPLFEGEGFNAVYSMVANEPLTYFDWLGLAKKDCCCKVCLYSATPKETFGKQNSPIVAGVSQYGHTWIVQEDCDSPNDEIVSSGNVYSFGPKEPITPELKNQFVHGGVDGGHFEVDKYNPGEGYVVVKRCWELNAEQCSDIDIELTSTNRYPEKFSSEKYCTTEAIGFLKAHGIKPPASEGPVKAAYKTLYKPNPKNLAENMLRNKGSMIKGATK